MKKIYFQNTDKRKKNYEIFYQLITKITTKIPTTYHQPFYQIIDMELQKVNSI